MRVVLVRGDRWSLIDGGALEAAAAVVVVLMAMTLGKVIVEMTQDDVVVLHAGSDADDGGATGGRCLRQSNNLSRNNEGTLSPVRFPGHF